MKKTKKLIAAVLAVTISAAMFTGCDPNKEETSDTGENISDTSTNILSTLTESEESDTSSGQGDSSAEFDFDEAVKNITLFGHKISLPCTIADFGEDFSLNSEPLDKPLSAGENRVVCNLVYKGLKIGNVTIANCTPDDDYNNKIIDSLQLGFAVDYSDWSEEFKESMFESSGWYQGLIEVNFDGITFESSEEQVKSKLGNPMVEQPYFENGNEIEYSFLKDDEGRHFKEKGILLRYLNGKTANIVILYVEN